MRSGLLTERQKEVLRYRKLEMTHQKIADITHTTKSNIWSIEKNARENIRLAKNALDFYYTLDARLLCTLEAGSDLLDSVSLIIMEAKKAGITITADPVDLINRIQKENPGRIYRRYIKEDIVVYLQSSGDMYFG
jgi:hypothetical protein